MKRVIVLFWEGLKDLFRCVGNWIIAFLGMKEEGRWGTGIRRTVGISWAVLFVLLALTALSDFCETQFEKISCWMQKSQWCTVYSISGDLKVYEYEKGTSDVVDHDGRHLISGLSWVFAPLGEDSLACFSNGRKRGYFHVRTGEIVIRPRYRRAWCFSDGLAAVQDEGTIKFLNVQGQILFDTGLPFHQLHTDPIFHDGLCIMRKAGKDGIGLINKKGDWALPPVYDRIEWKEPFYILSSGNRQSILTNTLEEVIPFTAAKLEILDDCIQAIQQDHTVQQFDLEGHLTDGNCFYGIHQLFYNSSELNYVVGREYDSENNVVSENPQESVTPVVKLARCWSYEGEESWYGLMTTEGKIITPPYFERITAVGEDLYFCEYNTQYGILLNGQGEEIH